MRDPKLHPFARSVEAIPLPERFTYPFHYTPHPLCVMAAEETQAYLRQRADWQEELAGGKMFGVLVVADTDGALGYLAAFSGNLQGSNAHAYFVPPVYDLSDPDGFFRVEEREISAINARIDRLLANPAYFSARQALAETQADVERQLTEAKSQLRSAKARRERLREANPDEATSAALIRESQHQKAEYKRLERALQTILAERQAVVDRFREAVERLRQERKQRSAALQLRLFERFRVYNARGESADLCRLFADTPQRIPPAGAGECAAPKLLQYAYLHRLRPLAMAEFWWGDSPKREIRRQGYYYPACKGKCEPILTFMLQGLRVDDNPLSVDIHRDTQLTILYEDDALLAVDKPAGMLSVPGKEERDSVYLRLRALYPEATGPLIVHRLDMATSGILLIAKTKEAHQRLQAQFANRTIRKRYIALLDGEIAQEGGIIDLPLCPDPLDRPRQIVSTEHGKPAITRYEVIRRLPGRTLVAFYPKTGRTHQLRVHAAHPRGLHCPIAGDGLYGRPADRLYLHAESLTFTHPVTGESLTVESPCPFFP